ncbi:hypothetical protein [Phenylobacterium sp.]|uniref:hypothetical protein n=1 Tax=Phenylobacterium sp. TaxID=1871053 RepID=UPI00271997DB|nr:hypothetical protein [Phenylobacterium sp.]MDO8377769.1 hypothetical protein [Phenylobacterium sp.]
MNRIDRATKRTMRERERKERVAARVKKPETTAAAAGAYDKLIERLTRAHCIKYARKNWTEIAARGLVEPALRTHTKEQIARKKLARYEPGLIDALFGLGADRRRALAEAVLTAAKEDADLYNRGKRAAEAHNLDVNLAASVLARDLSAIEQTLRINLDLEAITPALEGFAVVQPGPGRFIVYIDALELDALPDEAVVAIDGDRAGYLPMPTANLQELHISNICSISLRIGVEVLSVVGGEDIEVITRTHLLQRQGGEFEQHPVLYVRLPHTAMLRMDLTRLEPVSTITALGGRLDWDATRGFAPIRIDDLRLTDPAPKATPDSAAGGAQNPAPNPAPNAATNAPPRRVA